METEEVYTCSCGNETWVVLNNLVRCTACKLEFPAELTPVREFNHRVSEALQEAAEL